LSKLFYYNGYKVYVLCIYSSLGLKKYCKKIYKIKKISIKNIKKFLDEVDPEKKKSVLLGSGFAELITSKELISKRTNLGNSFSSLSKINSPHLFFNILRQNNIKHPSWNYERPKNKNWIIKNLKSYGGKLVRNLKKSTKNIQGDFFQKFIEGEQISIQFYVKNETMKILSICSQFLSNNKKLPFLAGGLITKKINKKNLKNLEIIALKITRNFNLNGINNIDLVLKNDDYSNLKVLEVNARPGLSTNIISRLNKDFLKKETLFNSYRNPNLFYSTSIIYSKKKIIINKKKFEYLERLSLSKKFTELPNKKEIIRPSEPICLLHLKSKKIKILKEKIRKISYKVCENLELL